jgi:chorismate synthase
MSWNTFGRVFRFTTWGESHGPALGAVVDGCPPGIALSEADIQPWLDKRRPGQSRFTTQRQEPDQVRILSGVFEGRTTGTPISLMIENVDQRSKDYSEVAQAYRPRSRRLCLRRENTAFATIAAGALLGPRDARRGSQRARSRGWSFPPVRIRAWVEAIGGDCDRPGALRRAGDRPQSLLLPRSGRSGALGRAGRRRAQGGVLARRGGRVRGDGRAGGWGAPLYAKLDAELAAAAMSINASKGVEIGDGFAAAALNGEANATPCGRARTDPSSSPTMPAGIAGVSRRDSRSGSARRSSRQVPS